MKQPGAAELRIRRELADMLVAEYTYWRNVEDETILDFSMGAMGGVSNVLAGLITGQDPAAYQKSIAARDGKSLGSFAVRNHALSDIVPAVLGSLEPVAGGGVGIGRAGAVTESTERQRGKRPR